jgi:hypothetical protein
VGPGFGRACGLHRRAYSISARILRTHESKRNQNTGVRPQEKDQQGHG